MVHDTVDCISEAHHQFPLYVGYCAFEKRKSKPNLEGQWAGAKSFSAFHQYFIWRGIEGQGMKGTKTHIHSGYVRVEKKTHSHKNK